MLTGLFSCWSLGRSIAALFSTTVTSSLPQGRAFSILSSALQMQKLGEGDKIAGKLLVTFEIIKEDINSKIGGGEKIIFPRLSYGTIAAFEGVDPPLFFNRYDLYHITFIKLYFIWPQEHFDDSVLKYCTFMEGRVSKSALERAKETLKIQFIGIKEDKSEKLVFMIGKEEIQPKGTPSTPLALLGDLPYTAPTLEHPPQLTPQSSSLEPQSSSLDLTTHETPPPPPSSATNSEIEKTDVQETRGRPTRDLYRHFDHNWARRKNNSTQ